MTTSIHATEPAMPRAFPRAAFSSRVTYYRWNRPFEAAATEIGGNGIFLRTGELLPEGSMITMRLALPGARDAFTVLAKVVRVVRGGLASLRPSGMGIQFLDIAAGDRRKVLAYVMGRQLATA